MNTFTNIYVQSHTSVKGSNCDTCKLSSKTGAAGGDMLFILDERLRNFTGVVSGGLVYGDL